MAEYLLAIDQGTSSSRAMLWQTDGRLHSSQQQALQLHYPQDGWVEQDPEAIWRSVYDCVQQLLQAPGLRAQDILALGISNQRETVVVWDKHSGQAIYPAIVWQDRRTAAACERWQQDPEFASYVQRSTGLLLDPYFSASKIAWILQHVPGAQQAAAAGKLLCGTIDCYLLWRLSDGAQHATCATNAARTLLYDIRCGQWDRRLLEHFKIPAAMLPQVQDNVADFGSCAAHWFGAAIPMRGVMGDQQAAAFGQACIKPGMLKCTYGTGCFMLQNTGQKLVYSQHRLLSTIAYQCQGNTHYALEGSIFIAGAAVQWLRDALHLIEHTSDCEPLAATCQDNGGVYLVPAFSGLGAPYWDPHARGALLGLTRDTGIGHIVRAALEAAAYQTQDLLQAMQQDVALDITHLRVDGGMTANQTFLQILSDIVQLEIERPQIIESSARGAALLAGLGCGVYAGLEQISGLWQRQASYRPAISTRQRDVWYRGWQTAVGRVAS